MANYLMRLLDPFGQELHAARIELEDLEYPDMTMDSLTGLMTTPEKETKSTARFVIKGGYDPRATYSVELTRQ